jgi:hypothetical protein
LISILPEFTANKATVVGANGFLYRFDLVTATFDVGVNLNLGLAGAGPQAFDGTNLLVVSTTSNTVQQVLNATGAPSLGFTDTLASGALATSVVWDLANSGFWVGEQMTDQIELVPDAGGPITVSHPNGALLDYITGGGGGGALSTYVLVTHSASPYTIATTNDIHVDADPTAAPTGLITVKLPASPRMLQLVEVKNPYGGAGSNNITVDGNGKQIDGASTYVIAIDYGSVTLRYNGTAWGVL